MWLFALWPFVIPSMDPQPCMTHCIAVGSSLGRANDIPNNRLNSTNLQATSFKKQNAAVLTAAFL